jgi:rhomboid-like protein
MNIVHEEVGRGTFLALFLTSGISGYLSSLTLNVLSKSYLSATLGASAAIFGLVGAYFTLAPTRSLTLPDFLGGKLEFSSWLPLALFFTQELLRWRTNRHVLDGVGGGSDHITHLGGLIAGAIGGWWVRRRLEAERSEDGEQVVQSSEATPSPFSTSVPVNSTAGSETSPSSS